MPIRHLNKREQDQSYKKHGEYCDENVHYRNHFLQREIIQPQEVSTIDHINLRQQVNKSESVR